MVDYSKWDNLEVSDDSDAEPHPSRSSSSSKTTTSQALATTTTTTTKSKESNPDPPTLEGEGAGGAGDDADKPRLSPTLQEYANIHPTNYRASHELLTAHPSLIDKSTNSDGLLMKEAFVLALELENTEEDVLVHAQNAKEGKAEEKQSETEKNEIKELVKQCVHQALLLQYCRLVSPDGRDESAIGGFFMRLVMPEGYGGGKAKEEGGGEQSAGRQRELLMQDVETRTGEIIQLAREARAEQLRVHLKGRTEGEKGK